MSWAKVNNILGYMRKGIFKKGKNSSLIMILKGIWLRLKFKNILSCKKKKNDSRVIMIIYVDFRLILILLFPFVPLHPSIWIRKTPKWCFFGQFHIFNFSFFTGWRMHHTCQGFDKERSYCKKKNFITMNEQKSLNKLSKFIYQWFWIFCLFPPKSQATSF